MNFRNLAMWAVIIVLTIGLYNMFKGPQKTSQSNNQIIFSEFLTEVDNGRIVRVEIQGNNIKGEMSNGEFLMLTASHCLLSQREAAQAQAYCYQRYVAPT